MLSKYQLPLKISTYIRRLEIMYRNYEHKIFHEIILAASLYIREDVSYDNWDGGTTGHAAIFFLEEDIFKNIKNFSAQKKITDQLCSDLNECANSLQGEFIATVSLELFDEEDQECKRSLRPFTQPVINPNSLNVWKPGYIRLFISHRDGYKKEASELASALEGYGISSFVAHDNIEPMEEWQNVIRKAMQSMEIMIAFMTDDFFDSVWTNQEIGFAIGKGIPIVPLKLQKNDPQGFISRLQALKGDFSSPGSSLDGVYKILSEKLGQEERLRKAAIQAFVTSPDFAETKIRFTRLQKLATLTEKDIQQIIEGFRNNDQLHKAIYLINDRNRLSNFLENRTGNKYEIKNNIIRLIDPVSDDLPF